MTQPSTLHWSLVPGSGHPVPSENTEQETVRETRVYMLFCETHQGSIESSEVSPPVDRKSRWDLNWPTIAVVWLMQDVLIFLMEYWWWGVSTNPPLQCQNCIGVEEWRMKELHSCGLCAAGVCPNNWHLTLWHRKVHRQVWSKQHEDIRSGPSLCQPGTAERQWGRSPSTNPRATACRHTEATLHQQYQNKQSAHK